jgi:hypothetical protein
VRTPTISTASDGCDAEVVDPEAPRAGQAATRAFFGATVRYANAAGAKRVVSIVGTTRSISTATTSVGVSPLGRASMNSAAGGTETTPMEDGNSEDAANSLTVCVISYPQSMGLPPSLRSTWCEVLQWLDQF